MATKTISVDLEAYRVLAAARTTPKESFSQVIKRGTWQKHAKTCGSLLAQLRDLPVAEEGVLDRLEAAQSVDVPPDDPWER
jgi:predicted CopG family antitoxin